MEQRINALIDRLASEGVSVYEWDIVEWGLYVRRDRLVVIRAGMTVPQRLAALTHEALHYWAGHDGHQSEVVEARINRQVALQLVSTPAYIAAERLHHGNIGGIAFELDLPVWVVQAFQESLSQTKVPRKVA